MTIELEINEVINGNEIDNFIMFANSRLKNGSISQNFTQVPDLVLTVESESEEQIFRAGMLVGAFLQKQKYNNFYTCCGNPLGLGHAEICKKTKNS